jgi:hypothetical protein
LLLGRAYRTTPAEAVRHVVTPARLRVRP